ncbi:hypothetical protein GUJ93_ZPchr0001g32108 [Zizania palustris]|uniref:Uncharacterized protein n=1 Tax=Zizania palustris TaxID=103762 RepID=A0A8J5RJA7_ZIZPA|nr:hypothetical protein GUJ93_ZPchr0001g32108 [Zizania palustris]
MHRAAAEPTATGHRLLRVLSRRASPLACAATEEGHLPKRVLWQLALATTTGGVAAAAVCSLKIDFKGCKAYM